MWVCVCVFSIKWNEWCTKVSYLSYSKWLLRFVPTIGFKCCPKIALIVLIFNGTHLLTHAYKLVRPMEQYRLVTIIQQIGNSNGVFTKLCTQIMNIGPQLYWIWISMLLMFHLLSQIYVITYNLIAPQFDLMFDKVWNSIGKCHFKVPWWCSFTHSISVDFSFLSTLLLLSLSYFS